MKEKVKNLVKDRRFQYGVATGVAITFLAVNIANAQLASQGFKMVRPVDIDGITKFETRNGSVFEVRDLKV